MSEPFPPTELERLRKWKREASWVLNEWEAAWDAAGRPGSLGASKARATTSTIATLARLLDGVMADDHASIREAAAWLTEHRPLEDS